MNVATFLGHYQITENPFRAEEARHDAVFSRVETACHHPDYEKIRGDFQKPATSIVFGERGSGKTALRLQIEDELAQYNHDHPEARCLPLIYDELNPALDQFSRRVKKSSPLETLKQLKLVDHIDAMMASVVPNIVDQAVGDDRDGHGPLQIGAAERGRRFRQLDSSAKHDLMVLQICYDRPAVSATRTARLKRAIRHHSFNSMGAYKWTAGVAALVTAAAVGYFLFTEPTRAVWLWYTAIVLLALFTLIMAGRFVWMWLSADRLAREVSKRIRILDRPATSVRQSLKSLSARDAQNAGLPRTDDDDLRYAMFGRLLNVIRGFGYRSIVILIDRVDEPTLVNGEPDRMRALVWPLLNNKFLQQDRVGVKLLLPLDLRHQLNRESAEFFREARLDKQNMIDRLTWSGATLYDLCTARLNACRNVGRRSAREISADAADNAERGLHSIDNQAATTSDAEFSSSSSVSSASSADALTGSSNEGDRLSLSDLFDERVQRQDLVDALDQMQQPRDAFKFIYSIIQEHCANTPEEAPEFKIPRPVLDGIRKQQVERLSGMLRGVRPA